MANMTAERTNTVVAIVNTNDDLVQSLKDVLETEGYAVVTLRIRDIKAGKTDFTGFLAAHDPAVVIYDIAVPYETSWTFFQTLRKLPECQNRKFIVTTVNKRVMEERVGKTDVIEIVGGRAQDFEPTLEAVKEAVQPYLTAFPPVRLSGTNL
jgi:CheY-like chemotaxis protein